MARSSPDGYSVFFPTLTEHLATSLHKRYPPAREFEPIGLVATTAFMTAAVPVKTSDEFRGSARMGRVSPDAGRKAE